MPPSGSTSAASRRSKMAPRRSATASGSRWSRTRWRRRSSRPSSTSSSARASRPRAACSTTASSTTSSPSRARSSPTGTSGWGRGGAMPRRSWTSIPRWRPRSRTRSTLRWASAVTWSRRSSTTILHWQPSGPLTPPSQLGGTVSTDVPATEDDERLQRALELAHAYLNRRERTVAEVRRQLERGGIAAPSAEAAIDLLTEQGYLDDARFAALFVSDKRELEQWGNERIRRGLVARGIELELAEQAIESSPDGQRQETEL